MGFPGRLSYLSNLHKLGVTDSYAARFHRCTNRAFNRLVSAEGPDYSSGQMTLYWFAHNKRTQAMIMIKILVSSHLTGAIEDWQTDPELWPVAVMTYRSDKPRTANILWPDYRRAPIRCRWFPPPRHRYGPWLRYIAMDADKFCYVCWSTMKVTRSSGMCLPAIQLR